MMEAWFSSSEMMKSSFPNTADTVPALAAKRMVGVPALCGFAGAFRFACFVAA